MSTLKTNQWKATIITLNSLKKNYKYYFNTVYDRYDKLCTDNNYNFFDYLIILEACKFIDLIRPKCAIQLASDIKIKKLENIPEQLTIKQARKFAKQPEFFKWFVNKNDYFKNKSMESNYNCNK